MVGTTKREETKHDRPLIRKRTQDTNLRRHRMDDATDRDISGSEKVDRGVGGVAVEVDVGVPLR